MNKIMSYIEDMTKIMVDYFPDKSESEIKNFITKMVKVIEKENKKNEPKYKFTVEFPDNTPTITDVSIRSIEKKLEMDKPIITKYGTCFQNQNENESIISQMLEYEGVERKKNKKEAFKHINDEDKTEMIKFDNIQKTIKILMNSFYGVLNAKGSIFYSPDCGSSITYTSENIIMTAINTFERFVANNIKFYSLSDMVQYCKNIINEEYKTIEEYDISFDCDFDVDFVYNYLIDHFYDHEQNKVIYTFDKNDILYKFLTYHKDCLAKIYFKNNLEEFLLHCLIQNDPILEYFESIFETEFLDPNNPNDEQKELLDCLREIILDFVFYNYQNFYKNEECKKGSRRAILTVDTDSTFIYLGLKYKFFKEHCSNVTDDDVCIITVINTLTYFLTSVINMTYENFTRTSNIPEDKRNLINMKNEFLISKIMLTKNKKNYAYSCLMREGNLIKKPTLEIRGLPIKKVDTNKNIREYFTELLENDIIKAKEIDYSLIIKKYFDLADIIEDSINKGETKYSIPCKVNEEDSYKDPYSIKSLRGALIWNILYPEEELSFPMKLNMMNLNMCNDFEVVKNTIDEYLVDKEYDKDEYEIFLERLQEIYNEEKYFKSKIINSICYPKNLKQFPLFLRPFINVDKMILDNINKGTLLLDALDINTPSIADNIVPTNYIKF